MTDDTAPTSPAIDQPASVLLPEWAPHEAVWIGFPALPSEWGGAFSFARGQIAAFANAIADEGRGEKVMLVVNDTKDANVAADLCSSHVTIVTEALGDVWLRDTAPIIRGTGQARRAVDFAFNGWGGKYIMLGDKDIGQRLADRYPFPRDPQHFILEGGAIDWDGDGLCVTTEQCVLNANRNVNATKESAGDLLRATLGFERILWLGDGLLNDHTDGHVDNLARFVGPGKLLLPVASGGDDPNADVYADAYRRAAMFGVDIVTIPSPGRVVMDGDILPASYMNFYIGNSVVAMPAYGTQWDVAAADVLQQCFPDRRIVPLPSKAILSGGGSFHCTSQQIPV